MNVGKHTSVGRNEVVLSWFLVSWKQGAWGDQLKEDWLVSSLATSYGKWDVLQRTDKKAIT